MLKFTIVKDKVVLDPNIVLFKDLHTLFKTPRGTKLLQVIYYLHSREADNPFRDISQSIVEENILQTVFNQPDWKGVKRSAKESALYEAAEALFIKYNTSSESRLEKSIDKKLDEISTMLNDTIPVIEESMTKGGETKFNSNLTIILNLFTKIETIMKSKTVLQNAIQKQEAKGRTRGGGTTSFREAGTLGKK